MATIDYVQPQQENVLQHLQCHWSKWWLHAKNKVIYFTFCFSCICLGAKVHDNGAAQYNDTKHVYCVHVHNNKEKDYIIVHSIPKHCKGIFI